MEDERFPDACTKIDFSKRCGVPDRYVGYRLHMSGSAVRRKPPGTGCRSMELAAKQAIFVAVPREDA